ncbi:MAG: hypothetical protein HYU87_05465 [Chloroflexi bacterium]|nr:hypothetical protein [Chloroflexota bacterium]
MTDVTAPTTTEPEPKRGRPRGLLFPAILITLGVLLLLGNFGYIPPISVSALFRLWPVLLIVGGIEAILGRRQPWAALALEIGVIAAAVALSAAQPAGIFTPASGGPSEATVEREGARTLSLRVSGGAGEYRVSGGAAALVEARTERGEIRARTTRKGDQAEVRVDPVPQDFFHFGGPPAGVSVRVASDVPSSIRLDGGAGEFTLDMREIVVTDARIGTGASKTHVILPTPRGDVPVRIDAGAASIEIEVPSGVEARITTRGGAISVNSSNPRIAVAAGAGETSGYAAAKDRVTVTFEGGAASLTIR